LEEESRKNKVINLKEKGRGFPLSSELTALCPDLSQTERRCTHAKIILFRD
jgi:hypothetical protein